jgi:hypothetical protein
MAKIIPIDDHFQHFLAEQNVKQLDVTSASSTIDAYHSIL